MSDMKVLLYFNEQRIKALHEAIGGPLFPLPEWETGAYVKVETLRSLPTWDANATKFLAGHWGLIGIRPQDRNDTGFWAEVWCA